MEWLKKLKVKIIIDIAMIALLPVLMAYQLVGEILHEWFGVALFTVVIMHNLLNRKWYLNLFKGRYTAIRILQTAVNFFMLGAIICLAVSGISMSPYLFAALPFGISGGTARIMHLVASYWAFALMSFHLGLHWNMILGMIKKKVSVFTLRCFAIILRVTSLVTAVYGVIAFIKREIGSYMFLRNEYVFYNFDEPLIFFFLDYIAVMGLFTVIAYYLSQALKWLAVRKKRRESEQQ